MTTHLHFVPALVPKLEPLCADYAIPLGIPVGWIAVESGGVLTEAPPPLPGRLDSERGLFQLDPWESGELMLDHARLSTDLDYSIKAGFILMHLYRKKVRAVEVPDLVDGSEFSFRLVKLWHTIGRGLARTIVMDAVTMHSCTDWSELCDFATVNAGKYDHGHDAGHCVKCLRVVDHMFEIGAPFGTDRLQCLDPGSL